ncbi:MAG TPA: hypothetical protein VLE89_02080 [Chlamydiales bacterium]|nr:hypothetical protein [Chlamydiales bacterium]
MANVQPAVTVTVDNLKINLFNNKKYLDENGGVVSRKNHFIDFSESANGAFRILQFFERITRAATEILDKLGSSMKGFFKGLAGKFTLAWTMLTIPRLPSVTRHMLASWKNLKEKEGPGTMPGAYCRKVLESVDKSADATAMYLYAISLVSGSTAFKIAGDVPDLVHNVAGATTGAQDHLKASKILQSAVEAGADVRIQKGLKDTKKLTFFTTMKAVCSAVTTVFALSLLALGGPLMPAIAMILVALAGTCFAGAAGVFEAGMQFKPIKFFDTKHVQVATAIA